MTFKGISKIGSKTVIALLIMSCLALAAIAQDVSPVNQGKNYGEPGFRGEAINLNVVNADIRDILNYITEQYGINFVIDKSVKAVPVTVNVSEVPWNIALDSILRSQELAVQHNGPILRIAAQKTLADERAQEEEIREGQLDQSPLYTEFIRLNYARAINTLGGEAGGRGGFQGGMTQSAGAGGGMGGAQGQGADQGILGIVQKRLSRRGTVEVDGRSNTLIITDVQQNIAALRKLVYYLDQPAPQVEIESRIVVASRNFSRDLGLQLSASGVNGNGSTSGSVNTNFGNIVSNTIATLTTSALGTTQITAALHAGEQKGQVKTIATPRITTLNNRAAEIESGQQIPVTTVQPNSSEGAVIVTTEYVPVPLRLQVTPQITNVGTVILAVVAENNSTAPGVSGGGAPPINVQRMQTEVMVPDGGTTVVGGAMFDSESEIVDRTPGLSRIPLIGNLFKRKRTARDTNEILFFITPRIYRPDYNGKRIESKMEDGPSSITLVQPVPLGNPASNSLPAQTPQSNPNNGNNPAVPASKPVVKPGN
ncbi:MAG: type IV pilus secretin PilQ [Pyrinomonadaceae bacterium]|nr:type IV pilus secretin PilQ [Pyrinomonadaceae bacterium]